VIDDVTKKRRDEREKISGLQEAVVRCSVEDEELLKVPAGVMVRLVDFGNYSEDPENYNQILHFCMRYFDEHGAVSSQIFAGSWSAWDGAA
jgi:hypothetical protein